MHRFFAPSLDPGDEIVALPRGESEHLVRVLRHGVGDVVSVFDGRGHEFLAKVVQATSRDARVQLLSRVEPPAEPVVHLTLAQAVLKGDAMDDVVRDAVMLGASIIQPIVSRRTEATVAALLRGARLERWQRIALASAKQSGRAVVPDIALPLTLEHYLGDPPPALRIMLVEPNADKQVESISALKQAAVPSDAAVCIGPEGGWDPAELDAARAAGVRLCTLGPRTLRADAVPVVAISVLQFLWEP